MCECCGNPDKKITIQTFGPKGAGEIKILTPQDDHHHHDHDHGDHHHHHDHDHDHSDHHHHHHEG